MCYGMWRRYSCVGTVSARLSYTNEGILTHFLKALTPEKDPVPILQEAGWANVKFIRYYFFDLIHDRLSFLTEQIMETAVRRGRG